MIKSKKQSLIVIGAFILVLLLGTTTYAFFNYTRTGSSNTIKTGRISFNHTQGQSINLTNMFPIDVTNGIPNDNTKVGEVVINVTGDTTYGEGIEYLVSAVNVTNTVGSKSLPISINVTVEDNDSNDPATSLGIEDESYFTNRGESAQSSIYKVLAKDAINENDQLLVGYIKSGATGVDGNIVIKAYIDKDKVVISDTYPAENTDTNSDGYLDGTPTSFGEGKTVFTTTEWNSLQTNGVSFKIKVESREGTWVENLNILYNLMKNSSQGLINDFSQTSYEDGTNGVYETVEGTTPIYYYRGVVDNNVKFGDYCWKAVRTTVTGGVKLIYNGEAVGNQCTTQTGTGTMINNVDDILFNNSHINGAYVGYTYINSSTGMETDSNMKQVIDAWYTSAITNNKIDDSKVETATYCNDRSSIATDSFIFYGPYNRLTGDITPSLNCPNASDNYNLKAGFITADEIVYAGGKYGSTNSTFYLNNGSNYWSGSPYNFYNKYGGFAIEFDINGDNFKSDIVDVNSGNGVRSVVSLVPGTEITRGSGTPTDPYVIE